MDRGPPEPKRMRSEYNMHSPTTYGGRAYDPVDRALPAPLAPPPPPGEPHRRHSNHYDDPARAYNGYPRDMKPESGLEQRPHIDPLRPNSTGHHPIHRRPVEDMRPPYDHHSMSNGSMASPYPPPPPQAYPERPYYSEPAPLSEISREPIGYPIEISTSSSSTQKKRSARTTQACEACRHAKAKCTDPKPCQGCQEKGIECKYDPPPPKQSDKTASEVTTQIDSLRELFMQESKQRREEKRREQERQNMQDRKLDAILKIMAKSNPELEPAIESENHVHMKSEEDEGNTSVQPSIEGGDDSEEVDDRLSRDVSIRRREPSPPVKTTYINELASNIDPAPKEFYGSGEDTFGDAVPADKDDRSIIPLRHTTGSHYVLQWPSVTRLWKGALIKPESVRKLDPYAMEKDRGILHLHGTGEGYERASKDAEDDTNDSTTSSVSQVAVSAPSPTVEKSWGMIGGSPVPEPEVTSRFNPLHLKPDRSPPFDEKTVRHLAGVYMDTLNIMHPIVTKDGLQQIIAFFLKEISANKKTHDENVHASFVGSGKRKRDSPYTHTTLADDIRLPYTMSTATMLLILALGRICDHKSAIPSPPTPPDAPAVASPQSITFSQSPSPAHRSAQLPSKRHGKPSASGNLNSQDQAPKPIGPQYPPSVKNVDVIPGLAYFALAANILGDHEGEYNLQMVQACLLAGLYHGQLARPLQSYSYIYRAGVCLQWVLPHSKRVYFEKRPRVEKDTTVPGTKEHKMNNNRKRSENHILFLFWTCLQLESDILAELDCPVRSGILELESKMPWPHTDVACLDGDLDEMGKQCYMTQLQYRNHLNSMHKDLYGPENVKRFQPELLKNPKYVSSLVGEIEALNHNLNVWTSVTPNVAWHHDAPPADNILEARLRGKYYGAQNITYRHFLRAVLDSDASASFPDKVIEYAMNCVSAMKKSCQSFTRCHEPGERLIVTNCWGTAHAQWGNTIVLHAVFNNPLFKDCISREELIDITTNVRLFLKDVAQYGSAIEMDLRFLDAVANETKILDEVLRRMGDETRSLESSFSSPLKSLTPTTR